MPQGSAAGRRGERRGRARRQARLPGAPVRVSAVGHRARDHVVRAAVGDPHAARDHVAAHDLLIKDRDLRLMNKAVIYVRDNEQSSHLEVVHVLAAGAGMPSSALAPACGVRHLDARSASPCPRSRLRRSCRRGAEVPAVGTRPSASSTSLSAPSRWRRAGTRRCSTRRRSRPRSSRRSTRWRMASRRRSRGMHRASGHCAAVGACERRPPRLARAGPAKAAARHRRHRARSSSASSRPTGGRCPARPWRRAGRRRSSPTS